jgi:benzoyl-CoA reductase subunit D
MKTWDTVTAGIDVGTSAVKVVLMGFKNEVPTLLGVHRERILRRDPAVVAGVALEQVLHDAKLTRKDLAYVASTGDGEELPDKDGHFYGMTTHSRGAIFLMPEVQSVVDVGALHARVFQVDSRSRVLKSRMTSQCASGTGQFLENIARYLGIRSDEVGPLSLAASRAEACSGICAVLSETDVINMVSRGIATGEILRGVHDSIATRLVRLLRSVGAQGKVAVTGGLAADTGLLGAMQRSITQDGGPAIELVTHQHSVHAGALGAALWGEFRYRKLQQGDANPLMQAAPTNEPPLAARA